MGIKRSGSSQAGIRNTVGEYNRKASDNNCVIAGDLQECPASDKIRPWRNEDGGDLSAMLI